MRTRPNQAQRSRRRRAARRLILPILCGLAAPALAADKSWDTGAGLWNVAGNWTPAGVPTNTDNVFLGVHPAASNATVTANAPVRGTALTISDGMRLYSESASVLIGGPVLITGRNFVDPVSYPSSLWLDAVDGASLSATAVQVLDGAVLQLRNDCYANCSGLVRIDATSALRGTGTLTLSGGGARVLINDGLIDPTPDGMVINQVGAGLLDLDGDSGNGEISLTSLSLATGDVDHLTVHGTALADAFDGTISLLHGGLLDMDLDSEWTLGANGEIQMYSYDPGPAPARIAGAPLTIAGHVQTNGWPGGVLSIEADATVLDSATASVDDDTTLVFEGAATVDGGTWWIEDGAEVRFHGDTTMHGGAFEFADGAPTTGLVRFVGPTEWNGSVSVDGEARQYNVATVSGPTVINAGVLDMDGSGSTVWNISAPFVVNADRIEGGASNFFEGEMNIAGGWTGKLTLNLAEAPQDWTMADQMNLTGDLSLFITRVAGSPMTVQGDLTVTGGKAQISADTTIMNFGDVYLAAASTALRFNGATRVFAGATFHGVGTLHNGPAGTMLLYEGATLDQVGLVNSGLLQIDDDPGVVSVDRFQNTATGTVEVSIGGYVAGDDYDVLIVSAGTTQLDGRLLPRMIDVDGERFEPVIGDEFTVLTSLGAISGTFAGDTVSFSHGRRFDWTVLYGTNEVTIRLDQISNCPPGDIDEDGDVDLSDLTILLSNFGLVGTADWPDGDLDGDGTVSLEDMTILLGNFGSSCL